ncbi:DUF2461 domain-containing protein [Filimonas effusa]|uniref:DUF2461 domain-containing protein n=1 Tax=Filimonas effusa TaxID=2508721 RepID=A0A4Q1D6L0_9BACT|nr:DUF2461 domain-containing protein [Filimonas effusa]RXK83523.1 DUF2461 domain-containing protein [Filimonas effusa]
METASIQFLKSLAKNNHKEWFDANRPKYEAAKADFAELVAAVISGTGKADATVAALQPKECIFRINRDVRFSKDKSPYKPHFGASITRDGRKSMYAGYYVHIQPGNQSFIGGGIWMPEPGVLKKLRQEIDYCFDEFSSIINHKKFVAAYGAPERSAEYVLSRPPKGYEADNPAIEFIKLKSLVVSKLIPDEMLTQKDLAKQIVASFGTLQPLIAFINRALE